MAAHLDAKALRSLERAQKARLAAQNASAERLRSYLVFLRDARNAGWSWPRIGRSLHVNEAGPRKDWAKHRQEIGRLGDDPFA